MAQLITVYWRDIPAQVIAKKGRKTSKILLSNRFQEGIDRAAMRAGKGSSDAYLADWRRESVTCDSENLLEAAKILADSLESSFSDEALEKLVKAKGVREPPDSGSPSS